MTHILDLETLQSDFGTVIIAAPDIQGRLFGKRMPLRTFMHAVEHGIHVSTCSLGWDIAESIGMQTSYTGYHTGWRDFRLVPDLTTLRPVPWLERSAIALANIVEDESGAPEIMAPRRILQGQVEALRGRGFEPYIATELEFFLYECSYEQARAQGYRDLPPSTAMRSDYSIQRSTNRLDPFFQRLYRALDEMGVDVYLSQCEWGYGQWEVNLVYQDALEMADRHVLFKLAVKDIASDMGMSATFMPRIVAQDVGSSCHTHISLRDRDGAPAFFDEGAPHHMSRVMLNALGGILKRAPELMPWYAPTINSYRRTASQDFAGHGGTWGFDNRTVSCRVLGHTPEALRIEYRVPGADVNPYLSIAALLASVTDGIAQGADPGPPQIGDAYQKPIDPLPSNLLAAAERFAASPFALAAFSEPVVEHYAAVARFEWSQFMTAVTDWEKERYFELI